MTRSLSLSLFSVGALLASFVPAAALGSADDVVAIMNSDGTLEYGVNVKSTSQESVGAYEIITRSKIKKCAVIATIGNPTSFSTLSGYATVVQRSLTNGKGYFVQTYDKDGNSSNREFTLYAAC
jgi:hypothetical protein